MSRTSRGEHHACARDASCIHAIEGHHPRSVTLEFSCSFSPVLWGKLFSWRREPSIADGPERYASVVSTAMRACIAGSMITCPRIRPPRTLRNPAPCPSSYAPSSPSPTPAPSPMRSFRSPLPSGYDAPWFLSGGLTNRAPKAKKRPWRGVQWHAEVCARALGSYRTLFAPFLAVCRVHILAKTLCHSASFVSQSRARRDPPQGVGLYV